MNKLMLLALLVVTACTTTPDSEAPCDTTECPVVEACGPSPETPAITASFETVNGSERAVMTRETYLELSAFVSETRLWNDCVNGIK